jgi:putative transposase
MLTSYKTEINPTDEQKQTINKTIGVCRYVYNFYLAHNKEVYAKCGKFISGQEFSKWLNNEFLQNNPDRHWIKEVSSKSVKKSIMNADTAFQRFFNKKSGFPKFKKKNKRGYIPKDMIIKSGMISKKAGRYYVSVLVEAPDAKHKPKLHNTGIGIDLGLKEFAVISDGTQKKNINKSKDIRNTEKKLKREQRKLSRKYESLKQRNKNMKGEATRQNIQKQIIVVQRLHQRLDNTRSDYINKIVNDLVKTKPDYITIEDLNVSGMMKNRHLARAVAQQKFYEFRVKLERKCKQNGIELRVVDRWYPSSKTCHKCGAIKSGLKLSDRKYACDCGYTADRDYNASLNLRDAKIYKIA